MRSSTIAILAAVALALCGGCSGIGGPAIGEGDMSRIISDIYLVDQWSKIDDAAAMRADTTLLYDGIFEKYGYTLGDYAASMEYYIRHWKTYLKVLDGAHRILTKGAREAEEFARLEGARLVQVVRTPMKSDKSLFGKWWEKPEGVFGEYVKYFRDSVVPYKIGHAVQRPAKLKILDDVVHVNGPEQGYDSGEGKVPLSEEDVTVSAVIPEEKERGKAPRAGRKSVVQGKEKGTEVPEPVNTVNIVN